MFLPRRWVGAALKRLPIPDSLRRRVMYDRERLLEFWSQDHPVDNDPAGYIAGRPRSEAVVSRLAAQGLTSGRVLEVGCNVGRNLDVLRAAGFEVEGIEINRRAIDLMARHHPQLAASNIHEGAAEDILPTLDGPYDVVMTMAVLEHIHPDVIDLIADQMARLGEWILTVEPFGHLSSRQFPHDVERLFTSRGMRQVDVVPMPELVEDEAVDDYALRLFRSEQLRN